MAQHDTASAPFRRPSRTQLLAAIAAMGVVVLSSNILVQYAINDWLTWGAITYPFAFLVSELVNRSFGPQQARRVAWVGFAVAVAASLVLAPPRIALASGAAFIASQWLDIGVFHRLRAGRWWRAPWWPRCWPPAWTPSCSGASPSRAPPSPG